MRDIVTRLRAMNYYVNGVLSGLPDEAADEIERLREIESRNDEGDE